MKINPWIQRRYFSNISSHASNFLPEVSDRPRQEKKLTNPLGSPIPLPGVLGAMRILGPSGEVPSRITLRMAPGILLKILGMVQVPGRFSKKSHL